MREVGVVLREARSGRLIARLTSQTKAGQMLVDADGRAVGRVTELFGPVKSPYASLRPVTDRRGGTPGGKVYVKHEAKP
ncbi:MAG: hypothetical protein JRN39_03640 [Nitrososphaerota archaeon]|nr:hypothetical protein [Nitrososphaerota archaeon]MDG6939476.1 hypothetical protein [Nitrososphaerota archaeon]